MSANKGEIRELDDIDNFSSGKSSNNNANVSNNTMDYYRPIHKNTKLLKFILYTTKIEIKSNSFMRMLYGISILELLLWLIAFFLFLTSPSTYFLVWVIIPHVGRGILGLILVSQIPKTYEILENLSKNPNFEEEKILEMVQLQLKETFSERLGQNRIKLLVYLVFNCGCLFIDFIIFWVQMFNTSDKYAVMQVSFMFILSVLLGKYS